MIEALIFDVDGTLAETEEVHRAAFNAAFAVHHPHWHWDQQLYGHLLKITGGKERLRFHAQQRGEALTDDHIGALHAAKNSRYGAMMRGGAAALRAGVEPVIRAAAKSGLRLAIATTTSRENVDVLIGATLGADGLGLFEVIVAGDEVARKKPAPDAYLRVLELLKLTAGQCLAFEDSHNGLKAALAAGIATIVTPGLYTQGEDFSGARQILPDLQRLETLQF